MLAALLFAATLLCHVVLTDAAAVVDLSLVDGDAAFQGAYDKVTVARKLTAVYIGFCIGEFNW